MYLLVGQLWMVQKYVYTNFFAVETWSWRLLSYSHILQLTLVYNMQQFDSLSDIHTVLLLKVNSLTLVRTLWVTSL